MAYRTLLSVCLSARRLVRGRPVAAAAAVGSDAGQGALAAALRSPGGGGRAGQAQGRKVGAGEIDVLMVCGLLAAAAGLDWTGLDWIVCVCGYVHMCVQRQRGVGRSLAIPLFPARVL